MNQPQDRKENPVTTTDTNQLLRWVAEYIAEDGAAVLLNHCMEWKIVHTVEEAEFLLRIEDITSVLPL